MHVFSSTEKVFSSVLLIALSLHPVVVFAPHFFQKAAQGNLEFFFHAIDISWRLYPLLNSKDTFEF